MLYEVQTDRQVDIYTQCVAQDCTQLTSETLYDIQTGIQTDVYNQGAAGNFTLPTKANHAMF